MKVVCAGECCLDVYEGEAAPRLGGITFNFAIHARRAFGPEAEIHLLSTVGEDAYQLFAQRLDEAGIHHDLKIGPRTPSIGIRLDEQGDRSFYKYDPGGLLDWQPSLSQQRIIADADLVVLTRYQEIEPLFNTLLQLPTRGKRVVDFADIAGASSITGSIDVTRTVAAHHHADVCIFGIPSTADTLDRHLVALADEHNGMFVITRGEAGAKAIAQGITYVEPAVPVPEVVDTTGAGDCFAAHFLSEWSQSGDLQKALVKGCAAASDIVQRLGAN